MTVNDQNNTTSILSSLRTASVLPSTRNNPLAVKLTKILSTNYNDDQTRLAFDSISEIYSENTSYGRRQLKTQMERRALMTNRSFINEFSKVISNLEIIEKDMELMRECCDRVETRLEKADKKTQTLLESAEILRNERILIEQKQNLLKTFLSRFTLSDEEIKILTNMEIPVDITFFSILKKMNQIYHDCQILLITDNQQAGLEIMETIKIHQETSFQKLLRWITEQIRGYKGEILDVSDTVKLGIKSLKQRPVLFRSLLEELIHTRQNSITKSFVLALTGALNGNSFIDLSSNSITFTTKPIELHAHDSLRYVGDMLAWLHQAIAGEREFLDALFDILPDNRRIGEVRLEREIISPAVLMEDNLPNDNELIRDIMDKNLEAPCKPLKTRIINVLRGEKKLITIYQISNLIHFYEITIEKTLSLRSSLSKTMKEIYEVSEKQFFDSLGEQAANLLRFPSKMPADFSPPLAIKLTIQEMKGIMTSYDSLLVDEIEENEENEKHIQEQDKMNGEQDKMNGEQDKMNGFSKILNAIIDPLIQMCEIASEKEKVQEQAVFMVNVLQYIQTPLKGYKKFTNLHIKELQGQIESYLASIIAIEYSKMLKESGLEEIVDRMEKLEMGISLSRTFEASQEKVKYALSNEFEKFLNSTLMEIGGVNINSGNGNENENENEEIKVIMMLSDSRMIMRVQHESSRMFVETYGKLSEAIKDPKNKYEFANTLLTRSVEEVSAILGVS